MLLIIFAAYIGLGIPDSILGAAWPAIYAELNLPVSNVSYITILISLGTIVSSFMSGRIIQWLGTAKVAFFSTLLTAGALFGFSCSSSMIWFCLLAFPLGIGAGSVDTALNNYVALHYRASHMNFLHCFYGVGVTLSPFLMSLSLAGEGNWRRGYRVMFFIQLIIAILLLAAMPLWKRVNTGHTEAQSETRVLSIREALRMRKAVPAIAVFMTSCAVETCCLVWANTFLVETRGVPADKAAGIVTVYFVGLTLGRFLSGLVSSKVSSSGLILIGHGVILVAVGLLLLPLPLWAIYAGLFLVGFGIGPVFPNMTHLTPSLFGGEVSQSMIGIEMGFSYVSILITPLIFGVIAQHVGLFIFPYYLLFVFLLMLLSSAALFRKKK